MDYPFWLTNRKQDVRIGGTLSDWKSPNGGIPQGTKLGVILFSFISDEDQQIKHLEFRDTDIINASVDVMLP